MNPGGIVFSHALSNKLSVTGTFKLIPSTLALMAVQRHNAASKSTNPSSKAQHLLEGGVPITRLTRPPRRSTHTPSFKVSLGHLAGVVGGAIGVVGGGAIGVVGGAIGGGSMGAAGGGLGLGTSGGLGMQGTQALENVENKMRERMKMD